MYFINIFNQKWRQHAGQVLQWTALTVLVDNKVAMYHVLGY